ncbi:MAG TPA: DUF2934 domain-containing protein [Opitutaceae bacterium]|nr:DUF2934 domain-containing protein [Opitutaceae bacterium]
MEEDKTSSRRSPAQGRGRSEPTHDEIAARARALWEKYGKPVGRDEMIWLEAERELQGLGFKRNDRFIEVPAPAPAKKNSLN